MNKFFSFEIGLIESRIETEFEIVANCTKIVRNIFYDEKFYYKFHYFSKKRSHYGKFELIKCIAAYNNYYSKLKILEDLHEGEKIPHLIPDK